MQLTMKIPLFENGVMLNELLAEAYEIELTHPMAVEMAMENLAWQVDDTYFDMSFDVQINGQLFFQNATTDAYATWRDFVQVTREPGEHKIHFLDSSVELQVIHQEHYIFQYFHTDYIWDDNGHLLNRIETTINSEPLPKEVVESAIRESFLQYAHFILTNDIPIATDYKENLQQQLQLWEDIR